MHACRLGEMSSARHSASAVAEVLRGAADLDDKAVNVARCRVCIAPLDAECDPEAGLCVESVASCLRESGSASSSVSGLRAKPPDGIEHHSLAARKPVPYCA